jgi:hypothetical protein
MAFSPISLATQQILETTYVSDMRLILNTNTDLFKNKVETLFNNLMIDLDTNTIGVDASGGAVPLSKIKTKALYIQGPDGKFAFSNGTADPLIEFSSTNNNSIGLIKAGALQISSAQGITTTSLTATGSAAFNGSISSAAGATAQFARLSVTQGLTTAVTEVTANLTVNGTVSTLSTAVITLSKTTTPILMLNLKSGLTFTGANGSDALPAGIQGGIDIILKNDPNNPISTGQQIKIIVKSVIGKIASVDSYINWSTATSVTTGNPVIRFTSAASSTGSADFVIGDADTPVEYDPTSASRWSIGLSNKLGVSSVTFIGLDTTKNSLNLGTFSQVSGTKWQARLGIIDFTPNCISNNEDLGLAYDNTNGQIILNTSLDA